MHDEDAHHDKRGSMARKPDWLKVKAPLSQGYLSVRAMLRQHRIHTVCESAACPNMGQCWQEGAAAFMILGNICTRRCAFCAVQTGRPEPVDPNEPQRLAKVARAMRLNHVVITSVDRDDLEDGGAGHFAECIQAIHQQSVDGRSAMTVEVLTPDFRGKAHALKTVLHAAPTVFNHNLETVPRLYPIIRPAANYDFSLERLRQAGEHRERMGTHAVRMQTKSGIMLGLGEELEEVRRLLEDLRGAGVERLTIGQYLQPTRHHHPVVRFVTPETFVALKKEALALGFRRVESHPLARSSFHANALTGRAVSNR